MIKSISRISKGLFFSLLKNLWDIFGVSISSITILLTRLYKNLFKKHKIGSQCTSYIQVFLYEMSTKKNVC